MANEGWKKLKKALGPGFEVPEPTQDMGDGMDLTDADPNAAMTFGDNQAIDLTQSKRPEAKILAKYGFQVPEKPQTFDFHDKRGGYDATSPGKYDAAPRVDLGETDVSTKDIEAEALKKMVGDTMDTHPTEFPMAPQVPSTETLVSRQGELVTPEVAASRPMVNAGSVDVPAPGPRDRSGTRALIAKAKGQRDPLAGVPSRPELNPGLSEADINSVGPEANQGPQLADAFPAEGPSLADAFPPGDAPEDSTGFAAVRRPLAPRPGSVPAQVGQAVTGATPPRAQSELELAQQRQRALEREAQYARGMGQAADIISGTRYNDRAGEDIRAQGKQGVQDVLDREAQGLRTANEGRAVEDQTFQRNADVRAEGADLRAEGADRRTRTAFDTAQGEFDPNHPRSKGARNALVAQYPKIAARVPPAEFAQMSEHDIKMLMGENPQQAPKGAGGGMGSAKNVVALSKLLPPETANVYAGTQRINELVKKGGGWEKVGGVGLLGGKMPTWMPEAMGGLNDNESALRSEIGNLAATHLQSKGGKAITSAEDKIILGKIAANPNAATPQQLQQGMAIIERNTAGNARQGLAVLPAEIRNQILQNAGVPPEWVDQSATAPTRQTGGPRQVRLKSGEIVEVAD